MIYFDNAATTAVYPELNEVIADYNSNLYYNPSARYSPALRIANAISAAREQVASVLGATAREIVFTSCATESNNTVFQSACRLPAKSKIVTTLGEHASVRQTVDALAQKGAKVKFAPLNADGTVNVDALLDLVEPDTTIVSVMHVSNETGAINPVSEIAEAVKELAPRALVHVDGVQGFGKYKVSLKHVDFYTASAHKIHAPKGIGALYVKKGVYLKGLLHGGSQEQGLRAGTENVSGIVAFGLAAEKFARQFDEEYLRCLRRRLLDGLSGIDGFFVNAASEKNSPHVVSCGIAGIRGETLMHALCEKGIVVGMGSACSANAVGNDVLTAIGIAKDKILQSVRVSLDVSNTPDEIDRLIEACAELSEKLRG